MENVVAKAVSSCSGVTALAKALSTPKRKVSRQSVHQWARKGYIPAIHALNVEIVTGGIVTANEVLLAAEQAKEARL